jgi:hypothetical protein
MGEESLGIYRIKVEVQLSQTTGYFILRSKYNFSQNNTLVVIDQV